MYTCMALACSLHHCHVHKMIANSLRDLLLFLVTDVDYIVISALKIVFVVRGKCTYASFVCQCVLTLIYVCTLVLELTHM